jgi:DNA-binding NarL/FixJ family response regulator
MSDPALKLEPRTLRVAIFAADPERRAELVQQVTHAGYAVMGDESDADVVLSVGDAPPTTKPVVTLGADAQHQAGSLPLEATAIQIDAALRAAAAGLIVRTAHEPVRGFRALRERDINPLLTPREVDMLSAIADGLSNKAIARRFDISLHTVKFHVESLFRKLGARTRAEAVAKGLERRRRETVEL